MKYTFILVGCFIITFVFFSFANLQSESEGKYTIVIHGGAGTFNKSFHDSLEAEYMKSLSEALSIGKKILENDGTSLDAVEKVITGWCSP